MKIVSSCFSTAALRSFAEKEESRAQKNCSMFSFRLNCYFLWIKPLLAASVYVDTMIQLDCF